MALRLSRLRLNTRPFPFASPTWPGSVPRPAVERRLGIDYDTAWARRWPARVARAAIVDWMVRPVVTALGSPRLEGLDRIEQLSAPVIFAANHASHLDTPLLVTSLPPRFRHCAIVAAGADYFFDTRPKSVGWALAIGAIPIERTRVSRRSADLAAELIGEGWNLVIFPEGGRTPDGWMHPFRGGAAYLALRCAVPVVPVHLEGTGRVLRKGARAPSLARTTVTFGAPIWPEPDEDARRFAVRIQHAVATLADEQATDWWSARRRSAAGRTPGLGGPDAGAWRRAWALGHRGPRRRQTRVWPK